MKLGIVAEDRKDISPAFSFLVLLASLAAGLFAMGLVFAASGKNPVVGIVGIFRSGFFTNYGIGETIARTLPLTLVGTGLAVAFRGKFWNIGAEGQILAGAMGATYVGLAFAALPDDAPRGQRDKARDHRQKRRFAGPGRPDHRQPGAGRHSEIGAQAEIAQPRFGPVKAQHGGGLLCRTSRTVQS